MDFLDERFSGPWEYELPRKEQEYVSEAEVRDAQIPLTPSEFIETTMMMPNPHTRKLENFSFDERRYLRQIYDIQAPRVLLMCGRQVEKSTTLGNKTLSYACLIPHFRILYVSPSSQQTKEFSKTRLREPLETCPDLRTWFPGHLTDNVFEKKAINRSEIKLRYAFLNADRCRGLSADLICMDEFQDLLLDNIPVIEEAASHSPFKWFIYSGTPKSLDNPIQRYWDSYSTQNEWAVPCLRHGFNNNPGTWHWNILGEKNIGINGLSCDKCGELIRPDHPQAQWVRTGNPNPKFDTFEGFRIPQLMVPWLDWSNILTKYNQYPRAKFYNEVLGASFDSGQRPLTEGDVQACCDNEFSAKSEKLKEFLPKLRGKQVYAGIDWGQDSNNSYTI